MKLLDLFSGIGGFSTAAQWAGIETVQFVEQDKYCQQVLTQIFPGVPIHGDIKTFKGERGSADIISCGWPCQPFSVAGKRRGAEDDRYLWPEMLRVIQEVRPTWVLGENVANFKNMGLDQALFDLESAGYETQPFNIPACAVDAPHERKRIWIVAYSKGERLPRRESQYNTEYKETDQQVGENSWREFIRYLWERESQPGVLRVAHGVPNRAHRIKALGNSIVPQIAFQIFKAIVKIEKTKG